MPCPRCGSNKTQYTMSKLGCSFTSLGLILLVILGAGFGPIGIIFLIVFAAVFIMGHKQYRCKECKYQWDNKKTKQKIRTDQSDKNKSELLK